MALPEQQAVADWLRLCPRNAGDTLGEMVDGRYQRDVQEQLAGALPVLAQATLRQAVSGLRELLGLCPNPTHQRFLLWLWTKGYERFGSVRFGIEGPGPRVWLPEDGADLAVAVGETMARLDIDPVTVVKDRHAATSAKIESNPRSVAADLLIRLERGHEKAERRRS